MAYDIVERADSVRVCWNLAINRGYVQQAVVDYTVPDFAQFISGLLPGVLMAMAVPIIGQMGGGVVGAVIGSFVGPEGTWAGAEIGQTLGLAAANLLLIKWGLEFIKDTILPQVGMVGSKLGQGMQDAWNAGGWGATAKDRIQDQAAREIADGLGAMFGLILMGIVLYLMKEPARRIGRFQDSILARTSPNITIWLENNLPWLQERYRNGLTRQAGGGGNVRVGSPALERARGRWGAQAQANGIADYDPRMFESELDPAIARDLEVARQTVTRVLPQLVDQAGRLIPGSLRQLDAILTSAGYRLIRADDFGPNAGTTGFQLFYRMGRVLIRFKTTGENRGPRQGIPHLSAGYFDGKGMQFDNDVAKFTADGTVVAKTQGLLDNPNRTSAPSPWTLLRADFDMPTMDAWAARCHFNAGPNFDLGGLTDLVRQVRPGWGRSPVVVPVSPQKRQ